MKNSVLLFAMSFLLFDCDIYEVDKKREVVDFGEMTIYRTKGLPAVIPTRAYFNKVYENGVTLNTVESSSSGTISEAAGGEYFIYRPTSASDDTDEQVLVDIRSSNGIKLGQARLNFTVVEGCSPEPIPTHVTTSNSQPVRFNILRNQPCGTIMNGPFLVLDSHGVPFQDALSNFQGSFNFLFEADESIVEYVPKPGFIGTEVLYYCICVGFKRSGYYPDEFWLHPEWWEYYYTGSIEIEVTE